MNALPARPLDDHADGPVIEELWRDEPGPRVEERGESRRRATRRDQLRRRRATRRRLVTLCAMVVLAAVAAVAFLQLAGAPDHFAGVWWEPSTGRRVELVASDDGYTLLYGAAKQRYTARLQGDELVVPTPLGGDIVIRAKGDDRLLLEEAGRTSTLSRLPGGG